MVQIVKNILEHLVHSGVDGRVFLCNKHQVVFAITVLRKTVEDAVVL
jgi:hypothetical protein